MDNTNFGDSRLRGNDVVLSFPRRRESPDSAKNHIKTINPAKKVKIRPEKSYIYMIDAPFFNSYLCRRN